MVYTDNFRRFNYDSRKIACYYGIAPFGKDSGTSVHSEPHVHYMSNRQIKAMLTQAALAAVNFHQVMARVLHAPHRTRKEEADCTEQCQEQTCAFDHCHGQKPATFLT